MNKLISLEKLQQELLQIVASILKVDKGDIELDDDLADYGADSIASIIITSEINKKYDMDVSGGTLFDYTSIKKLAQFLIEEYPDKFSK